MHSCVRGEAQGCVPGCGVSWQVCAYCTSVFLSRGPGFTSLQQSVPVNMVPSTSQQSSGMYSGLDIC